MNDNKEVKEVKDIEEVRAAMQFIVDWARANNIEFFSFAGFPFNKDFSITASMTYAIKDTIKYNSKGKPINANYKHIDLKE